MRIKGDRRKLVCALVRHDIAVAREVADVHAKRKEMPGQAFVLMEAGETLGLRRAIQVLSPGRWKHHTELSERIVRRWPLGRKRARSSVAAYEPS